MNTGNYEYIWPEDRGNPEERIQVLDEYFGSKVDQRWLILAVLVLLVLWIIYVVYAFKRVGIVTAIFNILLIVGMLVIVKKFSVNKKRDYILAGGLTIIITPLIINQLFGTVGIVDRVFAIVGPPLIGWILYNEYNLY